MRIIPTIMSHIPHAIRMDIEGIRTLAVALVLIAHSKLALPGGFIGVDVFFVVSGFLITGLLYRELLQSNTLSLAHFYARRIRRILPASILVLLVVLGFSAVFATPLRYYDISWDAFWSALSGINYRFALQGTDYFASNTDTSPFQHYWSLAVEEQFYLIWPALMLGITWLTRRLSSPRTILNVFLVITIIVSFATSWYLTSYSQPWAYFSLWTRAWELALGGILAINLSAVKNINTRILGVLSWIGLGMVAYSALTLTETSVFPGTAVILPVIGTTLLILAGSGNSSVGWSTTNILSWRPISILGKYSYSLYLWHWPILVLAPLVITTISTSTTIILIVLSIIVSIATYHILEKPVMNSSRLKKYSGLNYIVALVLLLIPVSIVSIYSFTLSKPTQSTGDTPISKITSKNKILHPLDLLPRTYAAK
jgi:peptidoglycan/LPS O-acetylase OafA/YrhL